MASSLKRIILQKILDAARNKGENFYSFQKSMLQGMYVSSSRNELLQVNVPVSELKSLGPKKSLSSLFSFESDNTIENVQFNSNKEALISINRMAFIRSVLNECVSKKIHCDNEVTVSKGSTVLIEFSSPNIAKPFHLGHLRSTIIGNFIGNIYELFGHKVTRINYLGDWGTQFGLLSLGLQVDSVSDEYLESDPINVLYSAYVKANKMASQDSSLAEKAREIFQDLENNAIGKEELKSSNACADALNQWEKIRKYTEKELSHMYSRLGVRFDEYAWESEYRTCKIMPMLVEMEQTGLLEVDSCGKKVVKLEDHIKPITLVKSDGTTLYLTRDIACALDRYKRYNFDQMLYVVDNGQSNHFKSLFSILERLGIFSCVKEKCHPVMTHVKFGRVRGMSTRKGTSVFLKDILDEAQCIMKEKILSSPNTKISLDMIDETAGILGTSAVIINDLKQRRQKEYDFEWSHILQVDGDTGIKLQYTHSRLCNLEKNCGLELPLLCEPSLLSEPEVTNLVREIARFEDVIIKSYKELEACHLVVYLFQLCNNISRAFKVLQVKGQGNDVGCQRLLLFHVSRLILGHGMKILGIKPLENM
ncbi:probable arginine--tRNA ligase, mitochondrial [Hetaerina americana]|uniref:probable arginine--tRNA ligase, mitochondrial n=1 Tax=Hetaerina americana TaxID=62018 RepID=UPI003A7F3E21